MAKKELKLRALVAPTQTVVVSAYDGEGHAQACTLAFYMVSSHVPPCVTIAINATQRRRTLAAILESGAFVLALPGEDQALEADYLGVETGYSQDKLGAVGWTVSPAETVHAPLINEMRLSLECQVVHRVTVGSHMQVTGEVKRILAEEKILDGTGHVCLDRLKPILYDEEQLQYLSLGGKVMDAFRPGTELKKRLSLETSGWKGKA